LAFADGKLTCAQEHGYPVVRGIPVMLVTNVNPTIGIMNESISHASMWRQDGTTQDELFLSTLALSEQELSDLARSEDQGAVDPVVRYLVAATCGRLYSHQVGRLESYPIPDFPMGSGSGDLLDIGCSWGRWSIAAARKGINVIGLDPSLGAVMAATRAASHLGVAAKFVVGDARFLPFRNATFSQVFSYSVLQHFSVEDTEVALQEIARVLRDGGTTCIQMANSLGAKSWFQIARRALREEGLFDVRYWSPWRLVSTFENSIGPSRLTVDGFFGLGLQASDRHIVPLVYRPVLWLSTILARISQIAPPLRWFADSVYVQSRKTNAVK
jgi:SAM-dependent methyltransferase